MSKFIEIPVFNSEKSFINVEAIQGVQSIENGTMAMIHFLSGNIRTIKCTLPYDELLKLLVD